MPRSRKSQRAKRKMLKIAWPIRCEDGTLDLLPMKRNEKTLDVTPHIASWNIITEGRYLEVSKGFKMFNLDRGTVRDLLQENTKKEVKA